LVHTKEYGWATIKEIFSYTDSSRVKISQKVLGGGYFLTHSVVLYAFATSTVIFHQVIVTFDVTAQWWHDSNRAGEYLIYRPTEIRFRFRLRRRNWRHF